MIVWSLYRCSYYRETWPKHTSWKDIYKIVTNIVHCYPRLIQSKTESPRVVPITFRAQFMVSRALFHMLFFLLLSIIWLMLITFFGLALICKVYAQWQLTAIHSSYSYDYPVTNEYKLHLIEDMKMQLDG